MVNIFQTRNLTTEYKGAYYLVNKFCYSFILYAKVLYLDILGENLIEG